MNKYDSFSICHLQLYLNAMKEKTKSDIVYWDDLKAVLKLCNLKEITKQEYKYGT